MGMITHPLPSSLPLEENIVAVDGTGVDAVDDVDDAVLSLSRMMPLKNTLLVKGEC